MDLQRHYESGMELPLLTTQLSNGNPYSNVFPIIDDDTMKVLRREVLEKKPVIRKKANEKYCQIRDDISLKDMTNTVSQHQDRLSTENRKRKRTESASRAP